MPRRKPDAWIELDGWSWLVEGGRVLRRTGPGVPGHDIPYEPVTRSQLLALPRDGEVWRWLREQGIRRPSPSGPSGASTPDEERLGTRMTLRLDGDTTMALDALARRWGLVRSQAIARAIMAALDGGPAK